MELEPRQPVAPRDSDSGINAIVQWGMGQPLVRVILLTSTRAIPNAPMDALSDYDVILIVQELDPFVTNRVWLNDFGEVLVVYWDAVNPDPIYGIEQTGNVTQYADGLKIDFTLWPVSLFKKIKSAPRLEAELDAGYRVLLDKDQLTAGLPPPSGFAYIPKRPSEAMFQTLVNDFWTDAPYVAKCLWRDELLPAKWCLDFDMKYNYLVPLLEWWIECEQDWSLPTGANGKGLKKHISKGLWQQLERTFSAARLQENWQALYDTLALFRQVALQVGERLGFEYPLELDQRVTAYVQRIQQMDSPAARKNTQLPEPKDI